VTVACVSPVPFGAAHAASYDDRAAPLAPILAALHHLIAARLSGLPPEAHILCVGVGTGAEVLALAARYPGWRFTGVDPAAPMLERCRAKVAEAGLSDRVNLVLGTTEALPEGRVFDAATAILVSQFLTDRAERIAFFAAIAGRLIPGGVLASVDLSAPDGSGAAEMLGQWFALQGATDSPAQRATFADRVAALPPAQTEAIIAAGGFAPPVPFFQALMIRGWFATLDLTSGAPE
jgi:tRNA (cmo5U34)-methyltransferase